MGLREMVRQAVRIQVLLRQVVKRSQHRRAAGTRLMEGQGLAAVWPEGEAPEEVAEATCSSC